MVAVPAGCFARGSTHGDPDEVPVSQICVGAFQLDRLEASVNDYARCVSAGACQVPTGYGEGKVGDDEWKWQCNWEAPGRATHPINCITYFQAQAYCTWRGKRLPTEAEWEHAARGTDGREYPWGNEPPTCGRCIMDEGDEGCGTKLTFPVGSRPQGAGPFGALDQAGSVWEWVEDCWEMGFYARTVGARDPVNRCDGSKMRVIRGGSYVNRKIAGLRSARRGHYQPLARAQSIGVRCARRAP
jgi:formylglycine-generating enzyme required for sulfatase activity